MVGPWENIHLFLLVIMLLETRRRHVSSSMITNKNKCIFSPGSPEGREEFGDRRDRTTGGPERDKSGERSMKDRVEGPTVGPGRGVGN